MCSVTFWPQREGYLLGMNRDERLTRVAALPPIRVVVGGGTVIHPREPTGGTWITLNDHGVVIALINWYSIPARAPQPAASRGDVVLALRRCLTVDEAEARLRAQSLSHTNPFRLIGIFEAERRICEWRWNLQARARIDQEWAPRQWLSSGYNEPLAQRLRGAAFEQEREVGDAGTVAWIRRLHSSHAPERGPFSTCMHRADAATVSYSEIEVNRTSIEMRYCAGPLCGGADWVNETAPRRMSLQRELTGLQN